MRYRTEAKSYLPILAFLTIALLCQFPLGAQQTPCDREKLISIHMKALINGNSLERLVAASWLGALRAKEAVPVLLNCLDDRDPNLRFHSIEALGAIGDQRAIPHLLRLTEDEDSSLQVIRALNRIDKNWRSRRDVQARYDQYEARFRLKYLEDQREQPTISRQRPGETGSRTFLSLSLMREIDPQRTSRFFAELVAADKVPDAFRFWIFEDLADSTDAGSLPLMLNALRRFSGDASDARNVLSGVERIDPAWRQSPTAENLARDLVAWTRDHPERIKLEAVIQILQATRDPAALSVLLDITKERQLSQKARTTAVSALAAIPGIEAKTGLRELAGQEDPVIGSAALTEIARLKDASDIPVLKRGLFNKALNGEARSIAAEALLELDPDSIETLIQLIGDGSEPVYLREQCVRVACQTKDKKMIPVMVTLLQSPSMDQRVLVAAAEELHAAETVQPLLTLLERENEEYEAAGILEAIARIAGPKGVPPLIRYARSRPKFAPTVGDNLPSEVGREVPTNVLEMLNLLASKQVSSVCRKFQLDLARENLIRILAECPRPEAIPAIEALLKDDSARVRACATYALYKIKSR